MSFSIDTNEMEKLLQCSICLDELWEPKGLPCQHIFCKVCLDQILEFDQNGSATIRCPLCKMKVTIAKDKTTNDLAAPYQLKYLLELYNKENERNTSPEEGLHCCGKSSCANTVSTYCRGCPNPIYFCKQCKIEDIKKPSYNRQCFHNNKYCIPLQHHKRENCLKVICLKHDTFVDSVCYMCGYEFLCTYCTHRPSHHHEGHPAESVDALVQKVRNVVETEKTIIPTIEKIVKDTLNVTKKSIVEAEDLFAKALLRRKMKCLLEYNEKLDKEELRLLKKFKTVSKRHISMYPQVPSVELMESIMEKKATVVLLERQNILNNYTDLQAKIPQMIVQLSSNCIDTYPLGKLDYEYKIVSKDAITASTFVFDQQTEVNIDIAGWKEKMNNFVEDVAVRYNTLNPCDKNIQVSLRGNLDTSKTTNCSKNLLRSRSQLSTATTQNKKRKVNEDKGNDDTTMFDTDSVIRRLTK